MIQLGGYLGRLLGPLLKSCLPLMKSVLKPLVTSVLIPLWLTAAAAPDAAIQKKIFGLGMKTLIISNKEMNDMKQSNPLKNLVY